MWKGKKVVEIETGIMGTIAESSASLCTELTLALDDGRTEHVSVWPWAQPEISQFAWLCADGREGRWIDFNNHPKGGWPEQAFAIKAGRGV